MPIGSNYLLQSVPLNIGGAQPTTMPVSQIAVPTPNERPAWSTGDPGIYKSGLAGVGQKVNDWLHAPGTAAMLLRSGAATMQGGLPAGIEAGAQYEDQQKRNAAAAQQQTTENALKQAGLNIEALRDQQNYDVGKTNAGTNAARAIEDSRHNQASEGLDANGQVIQKYGIDTNAATAQRGQDVSVQNNQLDNDTSRQNNASTVGASNYNAGLDYLAATDPTVHGAGIGSKNGSTSVSTKTPASTNGGFLGFGGTKVPATTTTVTTPNQPTAGEIRYDAQGNAYRRDPVTGAPVRVSP